MASDKKVSDSTIQEFKAIIDKDRETRHRSHWKGTLLQYLDLVKENTELAQLSHQRIYNMIVSQGVEEIDVEEDPKLSRIFKNKRLRSYQFFAEDFFGMETTIANVVRYFHSASLRGEESRQVLYLVGPVGSGKSSLAERLKSGLEDLPPFFAIDGCPMYEDPLHLIPRHLRKEFEKMLNVKIEGDICPVCRFA